MGTVWCYCMIYSTAHVTNIHGLYRIQKSYMKTDNPRVFGLPVLYINSGTYVHVTHRYKISPQSESSKTALQFLKHIFI